MKTSKDIMCFYCNEYAKIIGNYPINSASQDIEKFTPRCQIHWKFQCSKCGDNVHFNGIAWCPDCKVFTCVHCTDEKMIRTEFFVYDYYYNIPCHECGKDNPASDFAEFEGTHPYQTGDLLPEDYTSIWQEDASVEIDSQHFPHSAWGTERILSLGLQPTYRRLESLDEYDPKSTWDAMAPHWLSVEEENYHHKYRILPYVYRMLDVKEDDRILDVACGKGDVARHLADEGAIVTGIDISKMLDYAIETEEKETLGITYLNLNAERMIEKFEEGSFDKVVCNMALMDIEDFRTVIKQISLILKDGGFFVFSILHPAFSFPATVGVKLPHDSKRNEDRVRVIMDYFDERPILFDFGGLALPSPCLGLHFQRTISTYLNELVKNGLMICEINEPKVSKELVERFPKNAYWDDERRPEFLIVKTIKKSGIKLA